MKPGLIVIFFTLILLPLVLFFILGLRMADQEQEYVQEKFLGLLESNLSGIAQSIAENIATLEREFLGLNGLDELSTEQLRAFVRNGRMVRQVFVQDSAGELLYPPADDTQTQKERDFFQRTASIWQAGESFFKPWEDAYDRIRTHGWYTWFWGSGLNLIFWMRTPAGHTVGIEVDGIALTADIIGHLPDSSQLSPELQQGRLVLADVGGKALSQWGSYEPAEQEAPVVRVPLAAPLSGWSLAYYLAAAELSELEQQSTLVNLITAAVVLFALLLAMAVYFFRENSRAIREAARKVTFVNQVSHELKTPLTNIRLYAELLENRLQGTEDPRLTQYLTVIVSESQRLSRLIVNVLSFAGERRKEPALHLARGVVDEVIRSLLEHFRQSFTQAGIAVDFQAGAAQPVSFDEDRLRQILGNLLSNVEKYAAAGGRLSLTSRLTGRELSITVADRGPGVPAGARRKIFKPFMRLSNRLSDGVSGTGLGLTIARRLARAHGGDLVLDSTAQGASFTVTLEVETEGGPGDDITR